MNKVRLIAIDLDGTLLNPDHATISAENRSVLKEAESRGITVCISTGRTAEDASYFASLLGVQCCILACNGTRIYDAPLPYGRRIFARDLMPEVGREVLFTLLPYRLMINALEEGLVSTYCELPDQHYHGALRGIVAERTGLEAVEAAVSRGILKFYISKDADSTMVPSDAIEQARKAVSRIPGVFVTHSAPGTIEITSEHAGKGKALAWLAEYMNLGPENVMAIGDAENDLDMLRYAGHSVAMGNADDVVKTACRHITRTNEEDGVAFIVKQIWGSEK